MDVLEAIDRAKDQLQLNRLLAIKRGRSPDYSEAMSVIYNDIARAYEICPLGQEPADLYIYFIVTAKSVQSVSTPRERRLERARLITNFLGD